MKIENGIILNVEILDELEMIVLFDGQIVMTKNEYKKFKQKIEALIEEYRI